MTARVISAAVFAAAFAASAQASPWNRADGQLFVSTTANYYWSSTETSRYERIDSDTYLEFGVTPDWMAGGRVSYGQSFTQFSTGSTNDSGLNEAEFYVQRQFQRGEHSATSAKFSVVRSGGLSTDAQTGAASPNMEFEARVLHGRDVLLEPIKIFATAEAGYRRRFGGDADQIRAEALVGFEPSRDWLLLIEAQSITSLKNEAPGFADYDLYKGQASIVWRKHRRWSVIAGARREFASRNIASGTAFFAGLWSEF